MEVTREEFEALKRRVEELEKKNHVSDMAAAVSAKGSEDKEE